LPSTRDPSSALRTYSLSYSPFLGVSSGDAMTGMESVVHDHDRFARRACSWLLRAAGLLAALSVLIAPSIAHADDISYVGPLAWIIQ
jgi:hypothetical protein